jgi:hypothetical protein
MSGPSPDMTMQVVPAGNWSKRHREAHGFALTEFARQIESAGEPDQRFLV